MPAPSIRESTCSRAPSTRPCVSTIAAHIAPTASATRRDWTRCERAARSASPSSPPAPFTTTPRMAPCGSQLDLSVAARRDALVVGDDDDRGPCLGTLVQGVEDDGGTGGVEVARRL